VDLFFFSSVLKAAVGFNVDSGAWKTLTENDESFGYQVVQRQSDVSLSLLVSAPLLQYQGNKRGQIYRCNTGGSCRNLVALEQIAAVNMSLGLEMANDPSTRNTMVCGPTIPRECKTITMYNGLCFEIDRSNTFVKSYPSATEECPQTNIAFLLDGSGSVSREDFSRMKEFVKNMIRSLLGRDTQFAITQFSYSPTTHYYFNTFRTFNWESQINNIRQFGGGTNTAGAIQNVVNDVFSSQSGSRSNVKRILIVITDGQSQDRSQLPAATQSADRKNILRFAIGVGNAFTSYNAKQELRMIASQPAGNYVFQVGSFDALDKIRDNLQAKIFSIEGSQSGGETLKQEMSQEGFRAAYVSGVNNHKMTMVGANQWRGGYKKYLLGADLKPVTFEPSSIQNDSYLGYSMAVAKTNDGPLTILGAPRNQHKGFVMTAFNERPRDEIRPFERQVGTVFLQTGEYFGAEVCAMDMYKDVDREGRVYVCELNRLSVVCYFDKPSQITTLRGDVSVRAKHKQKTLNVFGFQNELNLRGSAGDLYPQSPFDSAQTSCTQRIAASAVQSGLKLFGISISQSSYDQSGDGLPDLAVGSKGKVVLLRSRPVVTVTATVSFNPNLISTQNPDCSKPLPSKATVCFTMSKLSNVNETQAQVNFTLTL
uniref:VWFA domain-containing protein n=1 Tax=Poecilia formosa TaxID=48698 RepID=A0A096LWE9_POEFO